MDMFVADWIGKPLWMWAGFFTLVITLLAFDLGILNRRDKELGIAQSLWLSLFYFAIAIVYGGGVWWAYERGFIVTQDGVHAGMAFFTGYFIEKALSIDNVFVISLIFGFFAIPRQYQYRALVWGIVAVIVLRGVMIGVGAALVQQYSWILYVFALFLVGTGIKMLMVPDHDTDMADNKMINFLRRYIRVTPELHGQKFLVRQPHPQTGRTVVWATPLLLALIVINIADLVFAVDSVPAIFAITTDTFIVYTANIMAILGLRALYFALAAMVHRFAYLKYALALVLVFIGVKIFWSQLVAKVDPAISLGVTVLLIGGGIAVSLWKTRNDDAQPAQAER